LTATGRVDLSRDVVVGDPVQKSALRWSVPYHVQDEAGNVADIVWRDVVVEEVKLQDIEKRIRNEIVSQQKMEVDRAIEKAVGAERRRLEDEINQLKSRQQLNAVVPICPECTSCQTSTKMRDDGEKSCPAVDAASCAQFCDATAETSNTRPTEETRIIVQLLHYFEQTSLINPSMTFAVLSCLSITVAIVLCRLFLSWIWKGESYIRRVPRYSEKEIQEEEERQRRLLESVTYYSTGANGSVTTASSERSSSTSFAQSTSPLPYNNGNAVRQNGFVPPPRASMSLGTDRGFLTPAAQSNGLSSSNLRGMASAPPAASLFGYASQNRVQPDIDDIYEAPTSIITPSKRGDGVSRTWTSPHSTSSTTTFSR
jgi:hypothetical protein